MAFHSSMSHDTRLRSIASPLDPVRIRAFDDPAPCPYRLGLFHGDIASPCEPATSCEHACSAFDLDYVSYSLVLATRISQNSFPASWFCCALTILPHSYDARLHQARILPAISTLRRSFYQLVRRCKASCRPSSVAQVHVTILTDSR